MKEVYVADILVYNTTFIHIRKKYASKQNVLIRFWLLIYNMSKPEHEDKRVKKT